MASNLSDFIFKIKNPKYLCYKQTLSPMERGWHPKSVTLRPEKTSWKGEASLNWGNPGFSSHPAFTLYYICPYLHIWVILPACDPEEKKAIILQYWDIEPAHLIIC